MAPDGLFIYKITHEEFGYDCFMGHVICADTEEECIKIAQYKPADEGKEVRNNAEIEKLGEARSLQKGIILSDFNAG